MNFDIAAFQELENQHQEDFNNVQIAEEEQLRNVQAFSAEEILENENDQLMQLLCNFTCQQFLTLYNIVSSKMMKAHSGGRRSRFSSMTIFLITLTYLKSAMPLTNLGFQFGLSLPYISTLVTDTVTLCAPVLAEQLIKWIPIDEYTKRNCCFDNFPQCVCAVDASVQEISRPKLNQEEFYSGKHHFHCLKMQVAVGPIGLAVDISGPFPGSFHDFRIFRELSLPTQIKINREKEKRQAMNPGLPTVTALFDKGYIGVAAIIAEAKLPIRKPRNRDLNQQELDYNNRIGHDRIIVERWFGRLKRIWRIMFVCFPLKIEKYKHFYMMCAALTNYHVQNKPLTNGDPLDPFRYEDNY